MTLRKPLMILFTLILLGFAGTAFGQPTKGYTYVIPFMDQFRATAGMPMDVPIFLENKGTASVSLSLDLAQGSSAAFTLDSLSQGKVLGPGALDVALLHFSATTAGTYQALLTVTDGSVIDSVQLTANVTAGPGPFVMLPPFQEVPADRGIPTGIPVSVQNLTGSSITVQLSFAGDSEFSYTGASSLTIPAMESHTVNIDFLSAAEGRFTTTMHVTDGSYSDSALIAVVAYDMPYTWILPFTDEIETPVGVESSFPVMVVNNGSTAVTLQLALSGSSVFAIDTNAQQVTLQPGTGVDAQVSVLGDTPGTYTALLTVTDGSTTDSLLLKATILPGVGNFVLSPELFQMDLGVNDPDIATFRLANLSTSTISLTANLSGNALFTLISNSSLTLTPGEGAEISVGFAGAAEGIYEARLHVTDGVETDSAVIVVSVDQQHGGALFTLQYDGTHNFMEFETPENTALTKDITITNISGNPLPVTFDMMSDGSFWTNATALTIPAGTSHSVSVTFDNSFGGVGSGMLIIDGGLQVEAVFLAGYAPPYSDYDGVLVLNELDFGMVDTASQRCLDVVLENRTPNTVTVTNATLSGFSSAYTVMSNSFPFAIAPNAVEGITVCFRPATVNQVENEVLTITFTNPASTPTAQTANVNLTGRSTTGISFPGDSCGIVGWYVNTISAPIGGQSDATIELFNITGQPITLDEAVWEDGNDLGIYSLQTSLPITIQPHVPTIPTSGKADITIRYAPTAQSSSVGFEDVATLRLSSAISSRQIIMWLTLVGIPVNPSPNSGTIALFPKNNRIPAIEMGDVTMNATRMLEFENNLQVPVMIRGFQLASDERFVITNPMDFPQTVAPGETAVLILRSTGEAHERATDIIVMQSSHEHLNSRFDLISGTLVTGIDDLPGVPSSVFATVSPNPSADRVHVALSAPLSEARIQVVDVLGRVVAEQHGALQNWTWDGRINGIPAQPGTYRVMVTGVTEFGVRVSLTKNAVLVR